MIDKYKQAFREEAREILVELEAALLQLNENRGDSELVGRAFRALHTIKGSGAMFGFDDLAGFTHNLENAFDEVRNGRLKVTLELINLSLAALDQIKGMLEEAAGHGANSAAATDILAKLGQLTGKSEEQAVKAQSRILRRRWLRERSSAGTFIFARAPISCAGEPIPCFCCVN